MYFKISYKYALDWNNEFILVGSSILHLTHWISQYTSFQYTIILAVIWSMAKLIIWLSSQIPSVNKIHTRLKSAFSSTVVFTNRFLSDTKFALQFYSLTEVLFLFLNIQCLY